MKTKNAGLRLAAAVIINLFASVSTFGADAQTTVVRHPAIDTSRLSPDLVSLGKLVQSGVDEKVVVTFIQNSPPKKKPTAEELVYLHELGLSSEAMMALMNAAPKVSLTETQPAVGASSERIVEPLLAQRAYQPGGTIQSASLTVTQTPAQNAPVLGNAVISTPAPTVVYTEPVPTTVYVQQPPVVTYVEPVRPRVSFSFGFGHLFGHHRGGHFGHHGGHWGGHHGGHWGGHHGGHWGGHHGGHWGGHGGHHGGGHHGAGHHGGHGRRH